MDGNNPINYAMLSNIYAEARYWKVCERIRKLFKMKGLRKEAGHSWVEIDKKVYFFYNRDKTHPLIEKIHQVLKEIEKRIKSKLGFVHEVRFALHDVEEESKEESLRFHNEKLAIELVLVVFLVKDANRFHKFEDSLCSCGDYW
ncbi:hypothetical protein ACFX2A_044516 [Malus domestica]